MKTPAVFRMVGNLKRSYPRVSRGLLLGGGLGLALIAVSYTRALLAPNSPGWDLRSAEWAREHHAGWALDIVEWCWLSVHPDGGVEQNTKLSTFPAPFARQEASFVQRPATPAPIAVVLGKPLPGEGEWSAIGSTVNGIPALRCSFFRPDAARPDVSVGVARFTPELTRFVLVPGTRDPGGQQWTWHGAIPEDERGSVLAAFNAGYRLNEAGGGFFAEGTLAKPLVDGAASIVIDKQGNLDIVDWTADKLTPDVVAVRQNLKLIVTDGAVVPGLDRNRDGAWGRLNHAVYMWRSGLGITRDGALIYLAGHGLILSSLAKALVHVGAVRAMELDIHQQWPSFNVYQPKSAGDPTLVASKLLVDMRHPAKRYLRPDDRDFVAAFVR